VQVPFPGERPEGIDLPHVAYDSYLFSTVDLEGGLDSGRGGHGWALEALAAIEFLMTRGIKVTFVSYMHNMAKPHIRSTWRDDPAGRTLLSQGGN